MQPYVIRQGDHLAKVAHRYDFDADTVWTDDTNADLQQQRPDPAILFPGDILYIPDQLDKDPVVHELQTGTTNDFVSSEPTITVAIQFTSDDGSPRSSVACQVDELPDRTDLQTDGSGILTVDVPVTLDTLHVSLADNDDEYVLRLGEMDPVDTYSGMFKRLQNLGYIDPHDEYDESKIDILRAALCLFRSRQTSGGNDEAPDAGDDASDPSVDSDASSSADCGCSDDPDASGDDDEASTSIDDDDVGAYTACGPQCSGLSDDGVLDDSISALLVKAHGS
jgi:hypothetical protein